MLFLATGGKLKRATRATPSVGTLSMITYFFTLVLKSAGSLLANIEDTLYEAGCSDALVCSFNGTVYLEFDSQAKSPQEAITLAIENVQTAGLSIASVQEGGVASMAEIASRSKLTRAAINNYIKCTRGPGNFPEPVYGLTSGSPLYSWPDVAVWLHQHGKVNHSVMATSKAAQDISLKRL
jgi:hypothetical protein